MTSAETATPLFPFDNSYVKLPDRFYSRLAPTPAPAPQLVKLNEGLARALGLDPAALASPAGLEALSGVRAPEGAEPLAMAYAGHQFGGWAPQLGDGRAILLGEVVGRDGVRRDIQLKGAGRTPYSRMGDGRAPLGPVLREYIVSEAMAALGVPTTRSLAAVATGEAVFRDSLLPGAVLTRVAQSHIRVGTFQYFLARKDIEAVTLLADHVIARHYPELGASERPYAALLEAVVDVQARLVAQWMGVGFIHGVMNTDNMTISGETIDYGPCAFMDAYHPETVYSSIDHMGRYAYANQPMVAQWNLACLAQCLMPLISEDKEAALAEAQKAIDAFPDRFEAAWLEGMRRKIGLLEAREGDVDLVRGLLEQMAAGNADFTLTFRHLSEIVAEDPAADGAVRALFEDPELFDGWAGAWRARLAEEGGDAAARRAMMLAANPLFIPRNHRVEEAIDAAMTGDLEPFERLIAVLSKPYEDQPGNEAYADPPRSDQVVRATFCGT